MSEELDSPTWWRRLCEVTPNLVLSGDLHHDEDKAIIQIEEWRSMGITHVIDCRNEWSDKELVATNAPEITYYEHGTHDSGGDQEQEWYETGWYYYTQALLDNPDAKVLVHCHMGVNRAPSLTFFLLVMAGHGASRSLRMIRNARPIAACYYAESAWKAYSKMMSSSRDETDMGIWDIEAFFLENEIDLTDVIHKIRLVEHV
tara:strand:- start:3684 stop:4289 length:606 start_codon:yes stop_codon:yes gene_type:complete